MNEIIEKAVTPAALADYLTANFGEWFGVHPDGSFSVGKSIGNEIAVDEQLIACIKCPGINNIDTTYFTDDFVTYNHISGLYESIEQDREGCTDIYTLAEVIRECCKNGDISDEQEELRNALLADHDRRQE